MFILSAWEFVLEQSFKTVFSVFQTVGGKLGDGALKI